MDNSVNRQVPQVTRNFIKSIGWACSMHGKLKKHKIWVPKPTEGRTCVINCNSFVTSSRNSGYGLPQPSLSDKSTSYFSRNVNCLMVGTAKHLLLWQPPKYGQWNESSLICGSGINDNILLNAVSMRSLVRHFCKAGSLYCTKQATTKNCKKKKLTLL